MKSTLTLFALMIVFSSSAFAKIVMVDGRVFIRTEGRQVPVFLVNKLIDKKKVKKVHLFGEGNLHLISFSEKGEKEKLYSVDNQGFIYAIEPFAKYNVEKVLENGRFRFKEVPGKLYSVTDKGFFIH